MKLLAHTRLLEQVTHAHHLIPMSELNTSVCIQYNFFNRIKLKPSDLFPLDREFRIVILLLFILIAVRTGFCPFSHHFAQNCTRMEQTERNAFLSISSLSKLLSLAEIFCITLNVSLK